MNAARGSIALRNIGLLATNRPGASDLLGLVEDAAVVVVDGTVAWIGDDADVPGGFGEMAEIDCQGRAVVPGFVDPHTHAVYAGDRADEFGRRLQGESYEEILEGGGGIRTTVAATRAATFDELLTTGGARLRAMLEHGTTTVEVKSGYGLDTATEVRILEVAQALGDLLPLDVVATFLGAHVVPAEYADRREEYVALVVDEMLPACAPLASACDVFCDHGAFTVDEAERILVAARSHGLEPVLHADQLAPTGAAGLGARLGARSVDHLDHATDGDLAALAAGGIPAVLLPGVSFSLGAPRVDGSRLWDLGVTVGLATDCNPGTSPMLSMPFMVALACLEMELSPERAMWSATRGGALALGLDDRGWIGQGALGDLVELEAPSYLHIPYHPDVNPVRRVIKAGTVVVE